MAYKGKTLSVDLSSLSRTVDAVVGSQKTINDMAAKRMKSAIDLVYRTARAKRPMITKQQMKSEGRRYRVSDPGAEAGVPVRTGALQISIKKEVKQTNKGVRGRVYTDSPYADFVEFGTSKMAARPFMRPALNINLDAIKRLFAAKENA